MLLSVCGGITVVCGAIAAVWKIFRPVAKLGKRVEELEKHDKQDFERFSKMEKMQNVQAKALSSLLNHMITGNGIDNMKKIRDELLEAIIEN